MKVNKLILLLLANIVSIVTIAQAPPQGINYQAVATDEKGKEIVGVDAQGQALPNKEIEVRFTILENNSSNLYEEVHTTNTNQYGLFNLVIGYGNQTGGSLNSFSSINWGIAEHFLKVELDIEGDGNFINMGSQQMMSVPYALYAETAGSGSGTGQDGVGIDSTINNGNGTITFVYTNGNSFTTSNLQGPIGPQGATGSQGVQGPAGANGISINWLGTLTSAPNSPSLNNAYYNSTQKKSFIWNGTSWQILAQDGTSGTGGGANTLNEAYNEGGAGAGRIINANSGSVEINGTNGTTKALLVTNNQTNAFVIDASLSGTGVAFRGESTNPANTYPSVQAQTNSSDAANSAVIGENSGAGYAVTGQIPTTATGTAAVYGNNLRTNGGFGVFGQGVNGVVGQSAQPLGFGVYGSNSGTGAADGVNNAVGTYGIGWVGVYGETTAPGDGWAGYFTSDVGIDGSLFVIGAGNFNLSDRRLKSNIRPIKNALDDIMKIEPKYYTITTKSKLDISSDEIIETEREEFGVIDQEIEKIFPNMVGEKAVFASTGDETIYKAVNYEQLIPVLIQAIKDLNEKVELLEKEINR